MQKIGFLHEKLVFGAFLKEFLDLFIKHPIILANSILFSIKFSRIRIFLDNSYFYLIHTRKIKE